MVVTCSNPTQVSWLAWLLVKTMELDQIYCTEYGADGEALGSIRLVPSYQHHVAVACIQPFHRLPSGQPQLFYDANNIYNTITSNSSAIQNIWI